MLGNSDMNLIRLCYVWLFSKITNCDLRARQGKFSKYNSFAFTERSPSSHQRYIMTFQKLFHGIVLFFTTLGLSAQTFNRPVPTGVPPYEFARFDTAFHGYYLTAPFSLGSNAGAGVKPAMILDSDGYLVWYAPIKAVNLLDFEYTPEHQQYSFIRFRTPSNVQFMVMDAGFQTVDSFTTVNGFAPDPHEFQISGGQTYLLPGISDSNKDLSGFLFNVMPGSANPHAIGLVVQEIDKDK